MVMLFGALRYTMNEYRADVVSATRQMYEVAIEKIDSDIASFSNIATEIYVEESLSRSVFEGYDAKAMEAHKRLSLYKNSFEVVEDMILCFDTDRLYTQEGYVSTTVYLKNTLKLTDYSERTFRNALEKRLDDVCISVEDISGKKGLLYIYSSPMSAKINMVTVIYYISNEILSARLKELFTEYDSAAIMNSNDGEILAYTTNMVGMTLHELEEFCRKISERDVVDGYALIKCESKLYDYSFCIAISEKQFLRHQYEIQIAFVVGGFVVFVILISIVAFMNFRLYKPISEIVQLVVDEKDKGKNFENNEYEIIRKAITRNAESLFQYINDYAAVLAKMRETLTLFLCSGIVKEEEQLVKILHEFEFSPVDVCFTVMGILLEEKSELLYDYLNRQKKLQYCAFSEVAGENILVAVVEFPDFDLSRERRTALGNDVIYYLDDCGIAYKKIAFGLVYDTLKDIPLSYQEMVSEINDKSISMDKVQKKIFFFEEGAKFNIENYIYHSKQMAVLYQAIRKGDLQTAMNVIHVSKEVNGQNDDEGNERFHRYSIIQTISNAILTERKSVDLMDEVSQLYLVADEEFEVSVCGYLDKMFQDRMQINLDHLEDKKNLILDYINENFSEVWMSQEAVGEKFGISRQKVNEIIRSSLGITYSNYVSYLRLDYAAKLLRQTDLKISEIVEKVGYSDTSRFINKFREYYKITPGKYRISSQQRNK